MKPTEHQYWREIINRCVADAIDESNYIGLSPEDFLEGAMVRAYTQGWGEGHSDGYDAGKEAGREVGYTAGWDARSDYSD